MYVAMAGSGGGRVVLVVMDPSDNGKGEHYVQDSGQHRGRCCAFDETILHAGNVRESPRSH